MIVEINKDEHYEIKFPEKLNPPEFLELLKRFEGLVKLIRANQLASSSKSRQEKEVSAGMKTYGRGTYTKAGFTETREKVLDLLQYYYHGSKEDRKRICDIMGTDWHKIAKRMKFLRQKWNIQPHEVGLNFWRAHGNTSLDNFKIPQYVIQSHTGIFDDKGEIKNGTDTTD